MWWMPLPKELGKKEVFFPPSQQLYIVSHQGQPRKGSRQGLRGRNKIRVHSKTSLSMMCSPWFLMQLRPKCKGVALPTVVWDLEYHSLIRKCLTDVSTDQADGSNYSMEVPSSQATLICVNLTKVNCTIVPLANLIDNGWRLCHKIFLCVSP